MLHWPGFHALEHFADVCAPATLLTNYTNTNYTNYTNSTVGTNMAALCVWKFLIELAELRAYEDWSEIR